MLRLTPARARAVAVRAQRLDAERPSDIVEVVDALHAVPLDPTAAIAPSVDHILWSRIGAPYAHADLVRALEVDRALFVWNGFLHTMADLALYRPLMRVMPRYAATRAWLEANAAFRRDVLARVRDEGPLRAVEIPDTSAVPWRSSGWTEGRNVQQMLELLGLCGDLAVSTWDARGRVWDLAERVYPEADDLPPAEAAHERAASRLRALGVARARALVHRGESTAGVEAEIDGVPGVWRVDEDALAQDALELAPRVALLSPLDRLVFDRTRTHELFGFEYVLEMYKPAAQRRWGYFALPILVGDELVGKLDAKADAKAGVLRVHALHEDRALSDAEYAAVSAEVSDLAAWLGLDVVGLAAP